MPKRPGGRRFSGLLFGAFALSAIGGIGMSSATFNDTETVDGAFSSGTIAMDPAKVDALTLGASNMMPGDSLTDDVVVENDGTAQLRYSLTTSSTNADGKDLRSQLLLTVKTIDVTTPGTPCNDFDGSSTLINGISLGTPAVFGNPAAGAQAGDRNLGAAASETLCFRISLPLATGNAYAGAATTTTFTFAAEQTVNNP